VLSASLGSSRSPGNHINQRGGLASKLEDGRLDDPSIAHTAEVVMPRKNNMNVSAGPATPRMSAKERQAARVVEVADRLSELKQEAAQRRAKREADAAASSTPPPARGKPVGESP
jgi:hypothetical protein